ncbi:hypothetical protein MWH25_01450 [Natroniella acetigena]|uniref:hypothetical protein n=1 Tax=Natroniella acetigena TaxID=52004 RepID=UPI002009FBA4|nr:hypothetical protein [Natroniella acetigena]MCK8826413.1 hypothetical protein [Natroniella acetigena]
MAGEIYLGPKGEEDKLTPFGREPLQINRIEETRSDEMASGRYVEDILWRKKEFVITYDEIKGEHLKQLIELYNLGEFLNLIIINEEGEEEEHEVKFQPFDQERIEVIGPWYWADVEITLRQVNPDASS